MGLGRLVQPKQNLSALVVFGLTNNLEMRSRCLCGHCYGCICTIGTSIADESAASKAAQH